MRIGVLADIHGQADRLRMVLGQMDRAGVDERWCLGDLIGGGPEAVVVVKLARQFELCLLGNHDAWMLAGRGWPEDAFKLRGREALWLSSLAPRGQRHGIRCWHGTPSEPLLGFFDTRAAAQELFDLEPGELGLVGHTHLPIAYARERGRIFEINAEPTKTVFLDPAWAVVANPGAVGGADEGREPWWLELDLAERSLRWHCG